MVTALFLSSEKKLRRHARLASTQSFYRRLSGIFYVPWNRRTRDGMVQGTLDHPGFPPPLLCGCTRDITELASWLIGHTDLLFCRQGLLTQ